MNFKKVKMVNFRYILPQLKEQKERQARSHKMIPGPFRSGRALQVDQTKEINSLGWPHPVSKCALFGHCSQFH